MRNSTAELSGFAEAFRFTNFIPSGERIRFFYDSKHAAGTALGVTHSKRNIALSNKCSTLLLNAKSGVFISVHHVFCRAGNPGNECADIALRSGLMDVFQFLKYPIHWAGGGFHVEIFSRTRYTAPQC